MTTAVVGVDPTSTTPPKQPAQWEREVDGLFDIHRRELIEGSAIDPAVIAERGYRTIGRPTKNDQGPRREMRAKGIPGWATDADSSFPALLLPLYSPTGEQVSHQFKPRQPVMKDGKPLKYASQRGRSAVLDVHPRWTRDRGREDPALVPYIRDIRTELWITEGTKKADSLTSRGICTVGLAGVYNWRSTHGTLGEWEDIPLRGRKVVVCFDSDALTKPAVLRAMQRIGAWLHSKGATVGYLIPPAALDGRPTKGVDDYFAAGGTVETLRGLISTKAPKENADDTFSDARMAEVIAEEVLADNHIWCSGLGWMRWTGKYWARCSDESVTEAVRQWVMTKFAEATGRLGAGQSDTRDIDGWRSMLNKGRFGAALSLARGIVEVRVEDLDAYPDLLNTPSGVVDLRTAEVTVHDPSLLLTKITSGSFIPGYRHDDWTTALTALPEDVRDWLQVRIGQGITGHPTPDGIMPVLQGGGNNGKSALTTDGLVPAFGDYASMASQKLVMATKGSEHSTEQADLRGRRLLIAEELTEGRSIDVGALKKIQDVSRIKARYVHKDNIEFRASHSLFATTNYIPVISETDHGTWRRLALVKFPYTYRKPGEPLETPNDRRGDARLKSRIERNVSGQHDAIVTWAVEGATLWYAEEHHGAEEVSVLAVPDTVAADTRTWRMEADRILGWWATALVRDPQACIATVDMHTAFNAWLVENGHTGWSKETFGPRFESHTETTSAHVTRTRTTRTEGISRPRQSQWANVKPLPARPEVWQGVRFRRPDEDPS